jgi:hypothetical protein
VAEVMPYDLGSSTLSMTDDAVQLRHVGDGHIGPSRHTGESRYPSRRLTTSSGG